MKNKIGKICIVLGAALMIGALALFLSNRHQSEAAGQSAAEHLSQLAAELETVEETAPPLPEVPRELLTPEEKEMTETVINGYRYIGYLSLPTLELELPILSDWDSDKLQIAPCRYYGTLRGNDLVLMAHNYERHFGRIAKLNEGDAVFFTDMDGGITEYEVIGLDILDAFAVEEMTAGEFDLTLFTCTYGGKSRVTVYCDKTEK